MEVTIFSFQYKYNKNTSQRPFQMFAWFLGTLQTQNRTYQVGNSGRVFEFDRWWDEASRLPHTPSNTTELSQMKTEFVGLWLIGTTRSTRSS